MLRRSEPTIAGVRTVVMQSGPEASEEAIVFVHGNPGFSRDWEDLMARWRHLPLRRARHAGLRPVR
jgi:pimeloyl-ACP methyl ester carboxylesterase